MKDKTKLVDNASVPANKYFIWPRRVTAIFLGLLFFAFVAPEFEGMPKKWIVAWTLIPLVPMLCVFIGSGRNRFVEAIGWVLLGILAIMFLFS